MPTGKQGASFAGGWGGGRGAQEAAHGPRVFLALGAAHNDRVTQVTGSVRDPGHGVGS